MFAIIAHFLKTSRKTGRIPPQVQNPVEFIFSAGLTDSGKRAIFNASQTAVKETCRADAMQQRETHPVQESLHGHAQIPLLSRGAEMRRRVLPLQRSQATDRPIRKQGGTVERITPHP